MVMNDLYGKKCPVCHPRNTAAGGISISAEIMAKVLRDIFEKKFNVREDIDGELYEATLEIFNRAADEGFTSIEPDDPEFDFLEQIRGNNEVFSAFRTHRMQNDIAAQLLDTDGRLKPFPKFQEDVQSIIGEYNTNWLQTEYDTAVLRAHQAADWKKFERDSDIMPNLRWMPTTSVEVDEIHRQFWSIRLTLPVNDSFWKYHRPGDRWNCKCSLEQTDDKPTPADGIPVTDEKPAPGLDNNPGEDGKLFSDSHPYIADAYQGAGKAVETFLKKRR
ncbi:hypothetical protein [Bacteroides sp. AM16-24]|jgi:hypothetical protein|uniref:phage head morphogenesis protein n=1 Tax=Bacteroides sp. AM16-24 TaxID=2292002 RepID=UPI001314724C|nr:hypothetical protein [Bacteroides sp. AM16-24]